MIRIKGNLYLDANGLDFRLVQRQKIKEGKNAGKTTDKILGYYPSIKFVIRAAAERQLMDFVSNLNDIETIVDELEQWAESIKSPLISDLRSAVQKFEQAS